MYIMVLYDTGGKDQLDGCQLPDDSLNISREKPGRLEPCPMVI